ncbi:MAG: threonine--tRNA ligase [Armatimonadetes bacterium]|nr:threonine--tRNA ligase [Armatimonadota bacterium]
MSEINITLPDGSQKQVARGTTALQVAEAIGARLAKAALAARFNDQVIDLTRPLDADGSLAILTFKDAEGQDVYWHSAAHIMADAVVRLFPHAKPTIGPAIEEGFYYDFHMDRPFTEDDLALIEAEMHKIVAADEPFTCQMLSAADAKAQWEQSGNEYKVELVADIVAAEKGEDAPRGPEMIRAFEESHGADYHDVQASLYQHGKFVDLCRGPHVPSTGAIKAFKLTSTSGAYWRGSEMNPMLQRIYGIAFPDQKLLDEYLEKLEQAKARDHRKLGRELDLFSFHEEAGAGLPYYHPKGAMLRHLVTDFTTKEHLKRGYVLLRTPHLIKSDIWYTSGHAQQGYPMYYTEIDGQSYGIKPMNCPGHILIYKTHKHSYRELPIRYFELGTVYRHERSGVLHGLLRVRGFTQDDAHIFCTPDQLNDEIIGVIDFASYMLNTFGFEEFEVYLSTRPEKSVGSDEQWEMATNALVGALNEKHLEFDVDEGGGAFYGPKIDIKVRDAIGRTWQCATIQCDFTQPERFDITYVGEDGQEHRPVMIHRVVLAGIERFLGVIIENYGGAFPVWLSPVQARVLPITDKQLDYAAQVARKLRDAGFRVELDESSSTLGAKIRDAEMQKLPYSLIVGAKEAEAGTVAVRHREEGDLGPQPLEAFMERLEQENVPGA